MTHQILKDVGLESRREFGRKTLNLGHTLSHSELFSDDALARLIEGSDLASCHINTMDVGRHDPGSRREGMLDGLNGWEALEAVRRGHIWILLQNPGRTDGRYADLLRDVYAEFESLVPGLGTFRQKMSILISSPNVQVYYHADVPGQTLWQVRGSKRVWVYPNRAPFLPQPALERIVLGEAHEISLAYDEGFDDHAQVVRLEPGRMLHWPLNCPHRIVNDDCLNVSFTTEHWTRQLRNAYAVAYANGLIRRAAGLGERQLACPTGGVGLYGRLAIAGLHKLSGFGRHRAQKFVVDFKLDPRSPGAIRSIPAFTITK